MMIVLAFGSLKAQDAEDVGLVSRFGIAGGFNPVYIFPDLSGLNTEIRKAGLGELNNGLILWGGGGYAYIMFVNNLRIGGIGLSGTSSTTGSVNNFDREVDFNFGLGGVTVEYTLPFVNRVALSVGAVIGVGTQSVEIYQSKDEFTWPGIWGKLNPASGTALQNTSDIIRNTFFTVAPTFNLDIPVSRFMALRVGGGYIFNFNDSWKTNNGINTSSVPASLTSNNFFLQTGIYFGFFAF